MPKNKYKKKPNN